MNGRTNSSGTTINDLEIPLDPCTDLVAVAGNGQVSLTWTDPKDKYATPEGEAMEDTDQLVSEWSHTVLVRKVGSQPNDVNDGIIVTSSSIRNQYTDTVYIDNTVTNETNYYYGVFAYNKDNVSSKPIVSDLVTPRNGKLVSELTEGTIIKINENGAPVEFYLAKHNYESGLNDINRTLFVRKLPYLRNSDLDDFESRRTYKNCWCDRMLNSTYINRFTVNLINKLENTKIYIENTSMTCSAFICSCSELGHEYSSGSGAYNDGSTPLPIIDVLRGTKEQWTRSFSISNSGRAFAWEERSYDPGNYGWVITVTYNTDYHYDRHSIYPAIAIDSNNLRVDDNFILQA